MKTRETTDYIILEISKIGRSEPENLKAIEKITADICEQFTGKWSTVGIYTGPGLGYMGPETVTLEV